MNWNVLRAILKRNFVSYFSSPTGYVFISVFVLLSSVAAFWPNEFFNANLANLDQLNRYLPYIMLVFIPAITMSIWAEERHQGTDELLLTIPAGDLEVVLGKFLAALAIFSVALTFSMFSNFCVLGMLGRPDMGLFVGTYVGYWMVGMAMLSVGMVASFLTGNLTVAFVLGAIFNLPLAFSANADVIVKNPALAMQVRRWSVAEQLSDFERGVLSTSSISYFVMITVVMLYLAVVLIGRRHWLGGRDGNSMLGHYLVRIIALVVVAVGVSYFFTYHDVVRLDITKEQLSSLSPKTRELIKNLDTKSPVIIEAYISPQVPTEYVQTRLDLLSTLDELKSLGTGKIQVTTHIIENFSEDAEIAEQKYGIKPRTVMAESRGATTREDIFLGVAFTCGLDKVVLPFIDRGLPAEYELVRSISTVAQPKRKKIGIVQTDAPMFGGEFNMQTMSASQDQRIVDELRKQYDVKKVDPSEPITGKYDALLAVQPSSLTPPQMDHFIAAVKRGVPTAIFEDPFPIPTMWPNVPGTGQPRRPPQTPFNFGGRQPPQPKGDIGKLWKLLGVDMVGDQVVWQNYNPYPKVQDFIEKEFIFVDEGNGSPQPFSNEESISSGLQQLLFIFPGSIRKRNTSKLNFTGLAFTGERTGTIDYSAIMASSQAFGPNQGLEASRVQTREPYVMAAHIYGKLGGKGLYPLGEDSPEKEDANAANKESGDQTRLVSMRLDERCQDDEPAEESDAQAAGNAGNDAKASADEGEAGGEPAEAEEEPEINVVLVADIDCLATEFFVLRERGREASGDVQWDFDNVAFVLNALDVLADNDDLVDIRKRKRPHRTLTTIEFRTADAKNEAVKQRQKFNLEFEKARAAAQKELDERIAVIQKRTDLDPAQRQIEMLMVQKKGQEALETTSARLQQKRDSEIVQIERALAMEIRSVQDGYKLRAVLIPVTLPLLLAFFVYFHRRQQEREGVARSRMR